MSEFTLTKVRKKIQIYHKYVIISTMYFNKYSELILLDACTLSCSRAYFFFQNPMSRGAICSKIFSFIKGVKIEWDHFYN